MSINPPFPHSPPSQRRPKEKPRKEIRKAVSKRQIHCSKEKKEQLLQFAQQDDIPLLLYRRGTRDWPPLTPSVMQRAFRPVWFAFGSERSTYGPVVATYELKRVPLLYNVGTHGARSLVFKLALESKLWSKEYLMRVLSADYQWSGTKENAATTDIFRAVLQPCGFEGTFIDDSADEDLQGAEEIVLWHNFSHLLKKY